MPAHRFLQRWAARVAGTARRTHLAARSRLIPYLAPYWGREERSAGKRLAQDRLPADARQRLQQTMLQQLGAEGLAIATSSGRTALQLALQALRTVRPERDEVVIPSYCCRGVLDPVLHTGLTPRWADIGPDLNLRPDSVRAQLGPRTLAVVAAHLGGRFLTGLDQLADMASDCGAVLIEDACQALGGTSGKRSWGTFAGLGIFSFGLGKITTATAGGLLVARQWIDTIRPEADKLTPEDPAAGAARFHSLRRLGPSLRHLVSFRDRLPQSPLQSAYGFHQISLLDAYLTLCQLEKLETLLQQRRRNAQIILEALPPTAGLEVPGRHGPNLWAKFTVLGSSEPSAQAIRRHLFWRGVETEAMYVPLHLRHQTDSGPAAPLPFTESVYRRAFNVPIRPGLSPEQVTYIAATLRRAIGSQRTAPHSEIVS